MQAPPSIRWGFDDDIHSLFVTPLWWANGELSFQRHGSELMFCNGSRMDEGDLAHLGPATIAGRTSLEVFLVPAHDCGQHRQLIWAHQLLSGKNTKYGSTVFSLSKTTTTNPNHQNCVFYILCTRFTMRYSLGRPKPLLYELSFRKSPIKNHATLFESGQVINRIKHS